MKWFRIFFSLYALLVFLALMLLVFPFALLSLFFGKIRGGNFVYRLCVLWADAWFALTGIRVKEINKFLYQSGKKYIIVPNHISYLDIPTMVKVFRRPLRPLGRSDMARIPVFGFIYQRAVVMVDRSNAAQRAQSVSKLKAIIAKGISVLVFPEGTFNETSQPLKDFYSGAFRIAIETQTPIKPVLFLDNFDRMPHTSLLSLTPGKCRVVYLPDIEVADLPIGAAEDLKEKTYRIMQHALIKYKASWIRTT